MYKAIIFDFFDVIHSDPFLGWLKKNGYQRAGHFEETSRLVDLGEISEHEFYVKLSQLSGQPLKSVQESFGNTDLLDHDLIALIDKIHRHHQIGLLSNASSEYLRAILAKHDLGRLFDEVVISAEVKMVKPTAEVFEFMLEKMAIKPGEVIFVDDSLANVQAAEALGIRAIVYRDHAALRKELSNLGITVNDKG